MSKSHRKGLPRLPEVTVARLIAWMAEDPLLCLGAAVCLCAALVGLFHVDRQSGGFWLSGDFDADGGD